MPFGSVRRLSDIFSILLQTSLFTSPCSKYIISQHEAVVNGLLHIRVIIFNFF
nr:MAG TPA: hypothetical protein [Caudoviricetes sp.]